MPVQGGLLLGLSGPLREGVGQQPFGTLSRVISARPPEGGVQSG